MGLLDIYILFFVKCLFNIFPVFEIGLSHFFLFLKVLISLDLTLHQTCFLSVCGFFVFLTILDEKKFKVLMDLIWADVSTEFEAPPFWLFLLLESLLTFQQCGGPEFGLLALQVRGVLFGIQSLCVATTALGQSHHLPPEIASYPTG